jgi:acetyl esterase/lipase
MNAMPPNLSKTLADGLAAIGRVIDPPGTKALYAPLHGPTPDAGVHVERDIQYGPHARNRLDIFTLKPADTTPKPVLIFVHGGGFVRGDKQDPGTPFFGNIGAWAARHGLVGVNMTYRLAPEAVWPAGAEDVGAAVRWVRAHIAEYGGNPARIYLMGHSAGATHVTTYVAQPALQDSDGPGLAGLIASSGIYDVGAYPQNPNQDSYFGADRSLYAERSPLSGLTRSALPLLLIHAELDPPPFPQQVEILREALTRAGRPPRIVHLAGHNHLSGIYSIGTADTAMSGAILEFISQT